MGRITLFQESLRNPDTTIRVQQDAGGGLTALGAGLNELGQVGQRAADLTAQRDLAVQQAARVQTLNDTRIKALSDLTDLKMKYGNDSDPATMQARWLADSNAIKQKYVDQFGEDPGLRDSFTKDFDQWQLRDKVDVAGDAARKISDAGRAQLNQGLDTLSAMMAQTSDPIRRQQIQSAADLAIQDGINAGYLTAVQGGEASRKFIGSADEAAVRGLIIANPDAALQALQDPQRFAGLDEVKRTSLVDMATRRVDSLRSDRIRLAEKADRDAEKQLKLQGDAAEKDLWGKLHDGTLSRDDIEAQRRVLDPAAYKGLLVGLDKHNDDRAVDDIDTVARLQNLVGSQDIASDATEALKSGHLKVDTFNSLMEKNRQFRASNAPDSPYKSGRSLISTTLDPGSLLSGPAATIARSGQAQALVEFDNWTAANPQASRADALVEAQNTIRRYQVINFDQMSLATGLPRTYSGSRKALTAADLDRAEQQTINDLDAHRLTREQATQELQKIRNWREILKSKAPGSNGATQ